MSHQSLRHTHQSFRHIHPNTRTARSALTMLGVVALMAALVVYSRASTASAAEFTVTLSTGPQPATITVPPGSTVRFVNQSGSERRMRSRSGVNQFDTGNLANGASATVSLPSQGTTDYRDERAGSNATWSGSIVVSASAGAGGSSGGSTPGSASGNPPAGGGATGGTTSAPAAPSSATVNMAGRAFSPGSVTIAVGGVVQFNNNDKDPHTATADGGAFDSGVLSNGSASSQTFPTAGSFSYFCAIHPSMRGSINVIAAVSGGTGTGGTGGATPTSPDAPAGDSAATTATPGSASGAGATATGSPASGSTDPSTVIDATQPGAGATGSTPAGPVSVRIADNIFDPAGVRVTVATTVVWTNRGSSLHTVTAKSGAFDSSFLKAGANFSRKFDTVAVVDYFCSLHAGMIGRIEVVAEPVASNRIAAPAGAITTPLTATSAETTSSATSATSSTVAPTVAGATVTASATTPAAVDVDAADDSFNPVRATVSTNGTVTWTLTGSHPHTITADDGSFDSGVLTNGGRFAHQFATKGEVAYHCLIHPTMVGTIVVEDASIAGTAGSSDPAAGSAGSPSAANSSVPATTVTTGADGRPASGITSGSDTSGARGSGLTLSNVIVLLALGAGATLSTVVVTILVVRRRTAATDRSDGSRASDDVVERTEAPKEPVGVRFERGWWAITTAVALLASVFAVVALATGGSASGTDQRPSSPPQIFDIELTELAMSPSALTVEPGRALLLRVHNAGTMQYDVTVPGVATTGLLNPGQNADLTIDDASLIKDAYCSVPGHRQGGMVLRITFAVPSGTTSATA